MRRYGTAIYLDPQDYTTEQRVIIDRWLEANGAGRVDLSEILIEDDRVTFDEICPRAADYFSLSPVFDEDGDLVTTTRTLPIVVPLGPYLEEVAKAGI